MNTVVIKVKDFDVNKIHFGNLTHSKNGLSLYDIMYDGKRLILQTDVMLTQFGLSKYTVYDMYSYKNTWSIDLSSVKNPELETKLTQLQEIIKTRFNATDVFPLVNAKNEKFRPFIKVKIDKVSTFDRDIKKGSEVVALIEFPKLFQNVSSYFMPIKLYKIKPKNPNVSQSETNTNKNLILETSDE